MKHHRKIYMDYAAATPLDPSVLNQMLPYFSENFYNPSASYLAAQSVARDIAEARKNIASVLGVKPVEIIFTAGGTEANNLAIKGIMWRFPEAQVVTSNIEHESVLRAAQRYNYDQLRVAPDGRLSTSSIEKKITDKTVLVSIILANNEIGTIQSIRKISASIDKIRQARLKLGNNLPLYLHTDASQAPLFLDLHFSRLGVDMMTLNGGKIYGPKQSGLLVVKTGITLSPLIDGGGQERQLRSGTENVPAIIGLSQAVITAQKNHKSEFHRLIQLRDWFTMELSRVLPQATVNGSLKYRLPNNINITIPGTDNERIMMELDELGIQCAVGSACSASNDQPSHVLEAIGLSKQQAQASLRFSLGKSTTKEDINYVIKALTNICSKQYI